MKFILMACNSAKEPWSTAVSEAYQKKISPFIGFEQKELKLKKTSRDDRESKRRDDSDAILKELDPSDWVVLFDENGKNLNSKDFSKQIQQILNSGKKRAVFVIGGAYGVTDDVKGRANLKVSLSPFVLNHLVAQTVALEQIYRAFAIINNLPYHND